MPQNNQPRTVYISKAADILEALSNLTYLICEDAEHPAKVRHYASMVEERLEAMKRLVASDDRSSSG